MGFLRMDEVAIVVRMKEVIEDVKLQEWLLLRREIDLLKKSGLL